MKKIIFCCLLHFSVVGITAELTAGPMLGHVALRAANIWIQSPETGQVTIEYWPKEMVENSQRQTATVDSEYGNIHTFKLAHLEPATEYHYRILINGKMEAEKPIYQFTTQTLWEWRTDPPDFTFLAGSCNFENQAIYDRPGRPYGAGWEIFERMAKEDAQMMLWLGDNWYYREVDYDAEQSLLYRVLRHKKYNHLQNLFSSFPNYAIWDDHDFGPDNSGGDFIFKAKALSIFKKFWANPSYGTPDTDGVFTKVQFNDVAFFLMDDRYHRSNEHYPDGPDKHYYGPGQMQWLKNQLIGSKAPFKIIAGGGQMLNDYHAYEGWDKYRYERDPFITWLHDNRITGVMFMSGDKHHTELLRTDRPNAYPLYELTCSPFTAGTYSHRLDADRKNPKLVEGTLIGDKNYCKISLSGPRKDRRMQIQIIGAEGQEYWNKQIKSSVLSYSQINGSKN